MIVSNGLSRRFFFRNSWNNYHYLRTEIFLSTGVNQFWYESGYNVYRFWLLKDCQTLLAYTKLLTFLRTYSTLMGILYCYRPHDNFEWSVWLGCCIDVLNLVIFFCNSWNNYHYLRTEIFLSTGINQFWYESGYNVYRFWMLKDCQTFLAYTKLLTFLRT